MTDKLLMMHYTQINNPNFSLKNSIPLEQNGFLFGWERMEYFEYNHISSIWAEREIIFLRL